MVAQVSAASLSPNFHLGNSVHLPFPPSPYFLEGGWWERGKIRRIKKKDLPGGLQFLHKK